MATLTYFSTARVSKLARIFQLKHQTEVNALRETRKHTKLTELTESTENPKILHNGQKHVTEF